MFVKWKEMILINKLKYYCIVLVIISRFAATIHCSPSLLSPLPSSHTPSIISFPPTSPIQWQNKYSLSYGDLARSYATQAQSAVGITVPHTNAASFLPKKILQRKINSNDDLLVPNEVYNYNQPIGAYQYTDPNGDLHVVTYVNSYTGLKILNDYKPYQPYKLAASDSANNQFKVLSKPPPPSVKVETDNKVRNYNNNDKNTNNNNNGNQLQTTRTLPAVSSAASNDNENVDWDEIEFTFAPQVKAITAAANVSLSNNKNYGLGRAETNQNFRIAANNNNNNNNNGNQQKKKLAVNSRNNNNNSGGKSLTELLLKVRDSIPLPKPFTPIDPREPPVFLQRPDKDNRHWRGPVIPQSILYGIPLKDSAVDLGPQPFPPFFNWNKYNIN